MVKNVIYVGKKTLCLNVKVLSPGKVNTLYKTSMFI